MAEKEVLNAGALSFCRSSHVHRLLRARATVVEFEGLQMGLCELYVCCCQRLPLLPVAGEPTYERLQRLGLAKRELSMPTKQPTARQDGTLTATPSWRPLTLDRGIPFSTVVLTPNVDERYPTNCPGSRDQDSQVHLYSNFLQNPRE